MQTININTALLLIFSILKGLLKLALIAVIAGGLFMGYLHFFQDQYPLPEVNIEKLEEMKDTLLQFVPDEFNSSLDLNLSLPERNATLAPRQP